MDIYRYSISELKYTFYHQIYIYIRMIYLLLKFLIFPPVIMLNMFRFKSYVLFRTHTLLDKSLKVLQLPTDLSNLTSN